MRDAFQADGRDASIGVYAFGFSWGAWVALLLANILLYMGARSHNDKSSSTTARWRRTSSTKTRASKDRTTPRRAKEEYP